jgi:hypothetical protein
MLFCIFKWWPMCSANDTVISVLTFEISRVGNEISFLTAKQLIIVINFEAPTGTTGYDMLIIN